MNELRHLDLCSGIGGFSIAFENEGFETIGFSEIDPYACAVLGKHWPGVVNYGDMRDIINPPECDVLTAGWPCQDIAICGPGTGLSGERSGLWREVFRIVGLSQPTVCLFENSPMLKSRGFDTVKMDMERIGYRIRPYVVDPRVFGVEQGRIRCWLVAYSMRERIPRHEPCENSGINGQGGARSQAYLPRTNWRTRPLFDSGSAPILCRRNDRIRERSHRVKCCGNSILPAVAQIFAKEIYKSFKYVKLGSKEIVK